jgi:hypothetical protein
MEHDFSARSLLCPRLDSGDPPDALAAFIRWYPEMQNEQEMQIHKKAA